MLPANFSKVTSPVTLVFEGLSSPNIPAGTHVVLTRYRIIIASDPLFTINMQEHRTFTTQFLLTLSPGIWFWKAQKELVWAMNVNNTVQGVVSGVPSSAQQFSVEAEPAKVPSQIPRAEALSQNVAAMFTGQTQPDLVSGSPWLLIVVFVLIIIFLMKKG